MKNKPQLAINSKYDDAIYFQMEDKRNSKVIFRITNKEVFYEHPEKGRIVINTSDELNEAMKIFIAYCYKHMV